MGNPNVVFQMHGFLEQGGGLFHVAALHFDIAEVGQRLSVFRIEGQLTLERGFRIIILTQLPVKIAESKAYVRLVLRNLSGGLELAVRSDGSPKAIESFAQEDVGGCRVRLFLLNPPELLPCTRRFLSP